MPTQALYDLTPLASMLLAGGLLALLPLIWVAWRQRHGTWVGRLQAVTLITLFLTFDLVLFGAFTRLSDSGLGCPDWPGCYGHASPIGADKHIEAAESAMPSGPVTERKAWIEMIHRYLATGVGALILVITAMSWRAVPNNRWWALATLFWVCVQGAFGALTVTMKLFPAIVTLHLLGGLALLALLMVQVMVQAMEQVQVTMPSARQASGQFMAPRANARLGLATLWLLGLATAAVVIQIALGGWVSTNYAVLACSDFPACQGSFWPPMNFEQGFDIWRALGRTSSGENISFAALTAIHFTHRTFAVVVLVLLTMLALRLNALPVYRPASRWLAGLLTLQLATGFSNVVFEWPLLSALLHTGGAAAMVLALTNVACRACLTSQSTGSSMAEAETARSANRQPGLHA